MSSAESFHSLCQSSRSRLTRIVSNENASALGGAGDSCEWIFKSASEKAETNNKQKMESNLIAISWMLTFCFPFLHLRKENFDICNFERNFQIDSRVKVTHVIVRLNAVTKWKTCSREIAAPRFETTKVDDRLSMCRPCKYGKLHRTKACSMALLICLLSIRSERFTSE